VSDELFATLTTNHGDITLHLFPNHAPKTDRAHAGQRADREHGQLAGGGQRITGGRDGLASQRVQVVVQALEQDVARLVSRDRAVAAEEVVLSELRVGHVQDGPSAPPCPGRNTTGRRRRAGRAC
jgi:hypothetical protein